MKGSGVTPGPEFTETGGYGSHQPALRALARFTVLRRVIEFGGGFYSTGLFLDREVFPRLRSLVTFESDKEWAGAIREKFHDDKRLRLIVTGSNNFRSRSRRMRADFVFVDCIGDRFDLVRHGLGLAPIVGMHDCAPENFDGYSKFIKGFNSKIQTTLLSNTVDLSMVTLA